jgi:hypothetical protein
MLDREETRYASAGLSQTCGLNAGRPTNPAYFRCYIAGARLRNYAGLILRRRSRPAPACSLTPKLGGLVATSAVDATSLGLASSVGTARKVFMIVALILFPNIMQKKNNLFPKALFGRSVSQSI